MRSVATSLIRDKIADMSITANIDAHSFITDAFEKSLERESNPVAKRILGQLIDNYRIAREQRLPICQDTGCVAVYLQIGQDVHLTGAPVEQMVQEGIRIGYEKGYLRKSMVKDPILRGNTGDNTPGMVHYTIVPGDTVRISVLPKGAGCESMSKIAMLKPADGIDGIKKFVIETIRTAGGNPCPPLFIGVGIGGSFEKVASLAKEALLLPFDESSHLPHIADLEAQLIEQINNLQIGPQGLGGDTTALGLRILTYPTHIAALPVAVNISCHALRRETVVI